MKWNEWGVRPPLWAKPSQENLLRMVGWMIWHCPPGTGFEIRALALRCLKLKGQSGVRARVLWLSRQAASTTAPWPPPLLARTHNTLTQCWVYVGPTSQTSSKQWVSVSCWLHYEYLRDLRRGGGVGVWGGGLVWPELLTCHVPVDS